MNEKIFFLKIIYLKTKEKYSKKKIPELFISNNVMEK